MHASNCCGSATQSECSSKTDVLSEIKKSWPAILSILMFGLGLGFDFFFSASFFTTWYRLGWYLVAYGFVAWPVVVKGIRSALSGDIFTEYFLMTVATTGAFCIGEYPEGVAVMLFYMIGEWVQQLAIRRSTNSIQALLALRPDRATVHRSGLYKVVNPADVQIGEMIEVKAGERVALDGELISDEGTFNAAALTGESQSISLRKSGRVLAGMVNQEKIIHLKVTALFKDSSLSRILALVQEATSRKAKTEQFIRKFSRVYTPVVVCLAFLIVVLPYFIFPAYTFQDWFYRALIFLVISCPCALVISIPLGYFGGIGTASRHGILFKGSNFLDLMAQVTTIVLDKTGTLTEGAFKVQRTITLDPAGDAWLPLAAALEAKSSHPIATAIVSHVKNETLQTVTDIHEMSGQGIQGVVNGKLVVIGTIRLLEKMNIPISESLNEPSSSVVAVAVNRQLVGYIVLADKVKSESREVIQGLHNAHIETFIFSGDKQNIVDQVAREIGIKTAMGELLPEQKLQKLEDLKKQRSKRVIAFVGDGINDAPILAASHVGVAMGGLGSDAAIETADVVIQNDHLGGLLKAIHISQATRRIVWQNIALAFGVKIAVLVMGSSGLATLWEAIFADVGVTLIAIFNAVRIQKMKV